MGNTSTPVNNSLALLTENPFFVLNTEIYHLGFFSKDEFGSRNADDTCHASKLNDKLIITDVHDRELCTLWPALL